MKHFPFVDEFGSVVDVLAELSVASRPTLPAAMEDPVLTHTITKVYNEFKIGRNGMKASDVPEALLVHLYSYISLYLCIRNHD